MNHLHQLEFDGKQRMDCMVFRSDSTKICKFLRKFVIKGESRMPSDDDMNLVIGAVLKIALSKEIIQSALSPFMFCILFNCKDYKILNRSCYRFFVFRQTKRAAIFFFSNDESDSSESFSDRSSEVSLDSMANESNLSVRWMKSSVTVKCCTR